jgi:hypothetical protein
MERFYIHAEAKNNNHLNEGYTEMSNPIFNTILQLPHSNNMATRSPYPSNNMATLQT